MGSGCVNEEGVKVPHTKSSCPEFLRDVRLEAEPQMKDPLVGFRSRYRNSIFLIDVYLCCFRFLYLNW